MAIYYVNTNAQTSGEHEVHKDTCSYLPNQGNRFNLGSHSTCGSAVIEAKKHFSKVDGCAFCSSECHRR